MSAQCPDEKVRGSDDRPSDAQPIASFGVLARRDDSGRIAAIHERQLRRVVVERLGHESRAGKNAPPWNTPFASTKSTVIAVPTLMTTTAGSGSDSECAASAASRRSTPTCSGRSTAMFNGTSRWLVEVQHDASAAIRRPFLETPIDARVDARDGPHDSRCQPPRRGLSASRRPGRRAAATPSRPRVRPHTGPTSSGCCRCPPPRPGVTAALRAWSSPRCGSPSRSGTRSASLRGFRGLCALHLGEQLRHPADQLSTAPAPSRTRSAAPRGRGRRRASSRPRRRRSARPC